MSITTKMPLNWYSSMKKKFRKIRIIFDIENWLWKSEIRIFQSPPAKRTLICQKKFLYGKVLFFTQLLVLFWNVHVKPILTHSALLQRLINLKICLVQKQLKAQNKKQTSESILFFLIHCVSMIFLTSLCFKATYILHAFWGSQHFCFVSFEWLYLVVWI